MGRKKQQLTIQIDQLTAKGVSGLDHNEKRWTCRGAAVGDTVSVRTGRKGKATLLDIVEPSPDRIPPKCEHFLTCGGCQFQHMSLEKQRYHKQQMIERLFSDFTGTIHPICGADDGYHYRNKLELSFGPRKYHATPPPEKPPDGQYLGMHPWGWFSKIVPLSCCPLAEKSIEEAIRLLSKQQFSSVWNPYQHTGAWRHVVLREGGGLSITLVTSSEANREEVVTIAQALQDLPNVRGIIWTINDGLAEVATGVCKEILYGNPDLEIPINDKKMIIPYNGFAQVNNQGAQLLFSVLEQASNKARGTLLDLYCGSGSIGLALATHFEHIIGVELQEDAIACAQENALPCRGRPRTPSGAAAGARRAGGQQSGAAAASH